MIIIKNIILYFIQIRHTDDFPSTGTRLVQCLLLLKRQLTRYLITKAGSLELFEGAGCS